MNSLKTYNYGRQKIESNDINFVIKTLKSEFLSQGPKLQEFEEKIATYCKAQYCLAVCNGTAGLHLACLSLGVGNEPDDKGWTSPLSFVASANCIRYCGAEPDFIDIRPGDFNMDVDLLEQRLKQSSKDGNLPKVIIPVHFAGHSCNMRRIQELSQEYGVPVIEDACHALGGTYEGKPIGCCDFSRITVFSLHPVKSITTGEGGLVLTNDKQLYLKMRSMRSHGLSKAEPECSNLPPFHVEMENDGFNYKLTDFQCALGISQLSKLDQYISKRRVLARHYLKRLGALSGIEFQNTGNHFESSACHLMIGLFDFDNLGIEKVNFYNNLKKNGINLAVHYNPIHLHKFYKKKGFRQGLFPNAEQYYKQAFSLPLHPNLQLEDIDTICNIVIDCLSIV